jgi:hypothetical protein
MTDEDFDRYLAEAVEAFNAKQARLRPLGIGANRGRWLFDQATQTLRFFDEADALMVEADVVEVGSFSPRSNSWMWGWSNDSLPPALREASAPLKAMADETGLSLFARPGAFRIADEDMAWHLTAMAVRRLGALGAYRVPAGEDGPRAFLAIMATRTP